MTKNCYFFISQKYSKISCVLNKEMSYVFMPQLFHLESLIIRKITVFERICSVFRLVLDLFWALRHYPSV